MDHPWKGEQSRIVREESGHVDSSVLKCLCCIYERTVIDRVYVLQTHNDTDVCKFSQQNAPLLKSP